MRGRSPSSGLTRLQKRLLVQGRLVQRDAAAMSDRAIARELGVSQPFVSALRRRTDLTRSTGRANATDDPEQPLGETVVRGPVPARPASERDVLGKASSLVTADHTTSSQQWLDRFHDEHSPLGRVRRVAWPVNEDVSHVLRDWDPFA